MTKEEITTALDSKRLKLETIQVWVNPDKKQDVLLKEIAQLTEDIKSLESQLNAIE